MDHIHPAVFCSGISHGCVFMSPNTSRPVLLTSAAQHSNNDLSLVTNKNGCHIFFASGDQLCVSYKAKTPQEGINPKAQWRQGQTWRPDGRGTL